MTAHRTTMASCSSSEAPADGEMRAGSLRCAGGLSPAAYRCEWWDTRDGAVVAQKDRVCDGGTMDLAGPAFTGDIALRVRVGAAGL